MGLLSDPVRRKKLIQFLEKWNNPLSFVGYIGGIVWLFLLASDQFNSTGYVSENALLPAMVDTSYSEDHIAFKFHEELKEMCTKDILAQRSWVVQKLEEAGLDVFHQNFTYGQGVFGENVYGILRSARSSGVESLVLNVPQKYGCNSNGALALMLSIVQHFKFQNYWAKDIIFLVSEHDSCGVEAWLGSYHGEKSEGLVSSDLKGHAGKIQAALVIDFPRDFVHGIDVLFESTNGLLPNLDLLHMVFRVARTEGVSIKLHSQDTFQGFVDQFKDYTRCLTSLYKMILLQATGFPSGVHGHYVKYRIESVTLKDSTSGERGNRAHFTEIGKTVEGIFRSFNNLQEHFHQSFFMYLLPASDRYISIALYMPVLGGILIGPLLHAISLWMQTFGRDTDTDVSNKTMVSAQVFRQIFLFILLSHSVGALLYLALPVLADAGNLGSSITTEIAVGSWMVALTFGYMLPKRNEEQTKIFKLIVIIYITAVLTMTSLLNFSLALLIAVPLVPMILIVDVQQQRRRFIAVLKYTLTLFVSPVTYIVMLHVLQNLASDGNIDASTMLKQSLVKTDRLLEYAIFKQYLNIWTWKLLCLVVLPIWILVSGLSYPF